jgi:arylformamidase
MHIEMFPYHIIHAECLGGDIDLLRKCRAVCGMQPADYAATIGFSRSAWRFVDGESCTGSAPSGSAAAWLWWRMASMRR